MTPSPGILLFIGLLDGALLVVAIQTYRQFKSLLNEYQRISPRFREELL